MLRPSCHHVGRTWCIFLNGPWYLFEKRRTWRRNTEVSIQMSCLPILSPDISTACLVSLIILFWMRRKMEAERCQRASEGSAEPFLYIPIQAKALSPLHSGKAERSIIPYSGMRRVGGINTESWIRRQQDSTLRTLRGQDGKSPQNLPEATWTEGVMHSTSPAYLHFGT